MVEEIEALLNDIKKTEFDLNPFQDCGRTRLSAKDILSAAEASGCVVEASVSNNSVSPHIVPLRVRTDKCLAFNLQPHLSRRKRLSCVSRLCSRSSK